MKIKLDENLGNRGAEQFRKAGHDVATVAEQSLTSASDDLLADACRKEKRCLVTLDLDFSNPFLFPPWEYSGIAVLRLPKAATDKDLWELCDTLIDAIKDQSVEGKLWSVSRGRVREYMPDQDVDEEDAG
jgi:predicted nuclease of predicted toxin-antitoxin system